MRFRVARPGRDLLRECLFKTTDLFGSQRLASDLPGGAKRLKQTSVGIKATVVAGEPLMLDGQHTGALPGQVLRGPLAQR